MNVGCVSHRTQGQIVFLHSTQGSVHSTSMLLASVDKLWICKTVPIGHKRHILAKNLFLPFLPFTSLLFVWVLTNYLEIGGGLAKMWSGTWFMLVFVFETDKEQGLFCIFWRSFPGTQLPLIRVNGFWYFGTNGISGPLSPALPPWHPVVRVCVRGFVIRVIFRPNHLPLLDALRLGKESKSNSTYFASCGTNRHYRLRDDSRIVWPA